MMSTFDLGICAVTKAKMHHFRFVEIMIILRRGPTHRTRLKQTFIWDFRK